MSYVRKQHPYIGGVNDEKLQKAQEDLRSLLVTNAKATLTTLGSCLTPENAPRVLRLAEIYAVNTRTVLTELTLGGEGPRRVRGLPIIGSSTLLPPSGLPDMYDLVPPQDPESLYISGAGGSNPLDTETYGAQAIEHITNSVARAASSPERRLESITRSISRLDGVSGAEELVVSLRRQADAILASMDDGPASDDGYASDDGNSEARKEIL